MKARQPMPWARFSYDDFFDDPAVAQMTNEQIGGYMRLLHAAHRAAVPGHLPDDDNYLAAVCRWTLEEWGGHRGAIGRAWTPQDGEWLQKRIIREHAECADSQRISTEFGRKGADKRWGGYRVAMQDVDVDLNEDRKRKDLVSTSTPIARDLSQVNGHVKTNGAFSEGVNGVNRTKEAQRQIAALAKAKAL